MSCPAPAELRREERLALVNRELPGILKRAATGAPIFAVAVDVSRRGLGVNCGERLSQGETLRFVSEDGKEVLLTVVWGRSVKRQGNTLFRHGLMVIEEGVDLAQIFFSYGRLDVVPLEMETDLDVVELEPETPGDEPNDPVDPLEALEGSAE